mmetsp:Transcript_37376/g.33514  ORF Transcript_37376/g.33514 Transcript_37376/m.33514 type:complete len:98 (-) Transcript_37376:511-804(-)
MAEIALKANIDNQSLIVPEMMPKVEFSLFKAALAKNDSLAKYINQTSYPNKDEFYQELVNTNGMKLEFVPEKFINKELVQKAISQDGNALKFAPFKY